MFPTDPLRVILVWSDEDEAGTTWASGVDRAWSDELNDSRQDLYTIADGQPIDAAR